MNARLRAALSTIGRRPEGTTQDDMAVQLKVKVKARLWAEKLDLCGKFAVQEILERLPPAVKGKSRVEHFKVKEVLYDALGFKTEVVLQVPVSVKDALLTKEPGKGLLKAWRKKNPKGGKPSQKKKEGRKEVSKAAPAGGAAKKRAKQQKPVAVTATRTSSRESKPPERAFMVGTVEDLQFESDEEESDDAQSDCRCTDKVMWDFCSPEEDLDGSDCEDQVVQDEEEDEDEGDEDEDEDEDED